MPNKKKQRNGFYYYMQEVQAQYRKEGKNYTMQDLPALAHPQWQKLPEHEKERYNVMAKGWKEKERNNAAGKLDCTGMPLDKVLMEDREIIEKDTTIVRTIKKQLSKLGTLEAAARQKFYVGSFNIFCMTEEGICFPAEFAVVEYSIEDGITREIHNFVSHERFPLGYSFAAKQLSEDTHKIPLSGFELADSNYHDLFEQLKRFVNPRNESVAPPIYCFPDEMEQAEGVLNWLCEESYKQMMHSRQPENPFRVFDLAHLLNELRLFACQHGGDYTLDNHTLAKDILCKTSFDYSENISCHWHEEQDSSNYCSLSIAKKYCFLMSDHLCDTYEVEMIPNRHVPARSVDYSYDRTPNSKLERPKPSEYKQPKRTQQQSLQSSGFVESFKSVYCTEKEKITIPGAAPGVRTEALTRVPLPQSRPDTVAGRLRNDPSNFNLMNDDFPSLSSDNSRPFGRGQPVAFGRGSQQTQTTADPENVPFIGIGRGRGASLGEGLSWSSVAKRN